MLFKYSIHPIRSPEIKPFLGVRICIKKESFREKREIFFPFLGLQEIYWK
jgi:hypothetical protein